MTARLKHYRVEVRVDRRWHFICSTNNEATARLWYERSVSEHGGRFHVRLLEPGGKVMEEVPCGE